MSRMLRIATVVIIAILIILLDICFYDYDCCFFFSLLKSLLLLSLLLLFTVFYCDHCYTPLHRFTSWLCASALGLRSRAARAPASAKTRTVALAVPGVGSEGVRGVGFRVFRI